MQNSNVSSAPGGSSSCGILTRAAGAPIPTRPAVLDRRAEGPVRESFLERVNHRWPRTSGAWVGSSAPPGAARATSPRSGYLRNHGLRLELCFSKFMSDIVLMRKVGEMSHSRRSRYLIQRESRFRYFQTLLNFYFFKNSSDFAFCFFDESRNTGRSIQQKGG